MGTINIKADSDVSLSGLSLKRKNFNDSGSTISPWYSIITGTTETGLSGSVTPEVNVYEYIRYTDFKVSGNHDSITVESPIVEIKQKPHPNRIIEGKTTIENASGGTPAQTLYVSEFGCNAIVKSYGVVENDDEDLYGHVVNKDYFTLSGDGNTFIDEVSSKTVIGNDHVEWKLYVSPNKTTSARSASYTVYFKYEDSYWKRVLFIYQSPHKIVIDNVVFELLNLGTYKDGVAIPSTRGTFYLKAQYTEDGVEKKISGITKDSVVGFSDSDITDAPIRIGNLNYRYSYTQNTDETVDGHPTKRLRFKAINPKTGNYIYTKFLYQYSTRQATYNFSFSDLSTSLLLTNTPYSSEQQDLYFDIISTKTKGSTTSNVSFSAKTSSSFVTIGSDTENYTKLHLILSKNENETIRGATITITQYEGTEATIMPNLTIYLSQKGENQFVLSSVDYMIVNLGFDFISGVGFDCLMYAPNLGYDCEKFKLVGNNAANYLKANDFADSDYYKDANLVDFGDVNDFSFAFAGNNTSTGGVESFTFRPSMILTEDFIEDEISNGKTAFDIDIYGTFKTSIINGIVTVSVSGYSDYENKPDVLTYANNYGEVFKPTSDSTILSTQYQNVKISKLYPSGQEDYKDFTSKYQKLFTLKYMYKTGVWNLVVNPSAKVYPSTASEKNTVKTKALSRADSGQTKYYGATELSNNEIYGNLSVYGTSGTTPFVITSGNTLYLNSDVYATKYTKPSIFYNQTVYQLIQIGNLNTSGRLNVITWEKDAESSYNMSWNKDECTYCLRFDKISDEESTDVSKVARNVTFVQMFGTEKNTIPTSKLTGTFIDESNFKETEFSISNGLGESRTITWNDTEDGSTDDSLALIMKSLNGYNESYTHIYGLSSYSSAIQYDLSLDNQYGNMNTFDYCYNSSHPNLLILLGKPITATITYTIDIYIKRELTHRNYSLYYSDLYHSHVKITDFGGEYQDNLLIRSSFKINADSEEDVTYFYLYIKNSVGEYDKITAELPMSKSYKTLTFWFTNSEDYGYTTS